MVVILLENEPFANGFLNKIRKLLIMNADLLEFLQNVLKHISGHFPPLWCCSSSVKSKVRDGSVIVMLVCKSVMEIKFRASKFNSETLNCRSIFLTFIIIPGPFHPTPTQFPNTSSFISNHWEYTCKLSHFIKAHGWIMWKTSYMKFLYNGNTLCQFLELFTLDGCDFIAIHSGA